MPHQDPLSLPDSLRARLGESHWTRIREGESGASVWESRDAVVKVRSLGGDADVTLRDEHDRLRWLAPRTDVPAVIGYVSLPDAEYLAMSRARGAPMSAPTMLRDPERLVRLLARTLRALHALSIGNCPFDMRLAPTLDLARARVESGAVDGRDFDDERRGWTAREVLDELVRTRPPVEDLVITHGDASFPNFVVDADRVALVDVGRSGIADRHVDLAIAHRSARFNLDERCAEMLLDAYGRDRVDARRLAYYTLLDELF